MRKTIGRNGEQENQIFLMGTLNEGEKNDCIVVPPLRMGKFEVECTVNVPAEGENFAPVEVIYRLRNGSEVERNTLTGRIKNNSQNGELLVYSVFLGPFELVYLVNIPERDKNTAPVYIKCKLRQLQEEQEEKPENKSEKFTAHRATEPVKGPSGPVAQA